jgi:hypothetical protein
VGAKLVTVSPVFKTPFIIVGEPGSICSPLPTKVPRCPCRIRSADKYPLQSLA